MIYIANLDIPARDTWGGIFATDVTLPAKARSLRSVMAMAYADFAMPHLDADNKAHYLELTSFKTKLLRSGGYTTYVTHPLTAQTGVMSVLINGHSTLIADLPVQLLSQLRDGTYNGNRVGLEGVTVQPGSTLKITYAERNFPTFVADAALTTDGKPYVGYTVSLYIDYIDKDLN